MRNDPGMNVDLPTVGCGVVTGALAGKAATTGFEATLKIAALQSSVRDAMFDAERLGAIAMAAMRELAAPAPKMRG